jgi:F0F1-type ATP synthase membrane subunit b/b'
MMRPATLVIVLGMAFTIPALPQEPGEKRDAQHEAEQGDPWIWWKWVNFAILAGGLGYLISKHAPAFFAQQSQEIKQAMADAAQAKQTAEAQAAKIEQRFAGLQKEIESLRQAARAETTAEGERISRETAHQLERVQDQAAQEMALMTRAAREELRKYSALLALDLAEQRIHSRISKDVQDELVDGFLQDLRIRPSTGGLARN